MQNILLSCFFRCVNLSIRASWLILAVIILRAAIKTIPKRVNGILWLFAGIRLILPFSFVSVFSLVPDTESLMTEQAGSWRENNYFPISTDISAGTPLADTEVCRAASSINIFIIFAFLWMIGVILMASWAVCQYIRLKKAVQTAASLNRIGGNSTSSNLTVHNAPSIYQCEQIPSPFVMGIIHSRIYLPFRMEKESLSYIIAHKQTHIQRNDHLFKLLGFLVLSIHWFNPFAWLWFILFSKDMEMACDEHVIQNFTYNQRQDYSMALLNSSKKFHEFFSLPPAFGGSDVKKRIRAIMDYRTLGRRQKLGVAGLCILVLLCFMTNPMDTAGKPWFRRAEREISGIEHYIFPKDFSGYSKLDIFPQKLLPSAAEGEYHYQMKDTLFDPTVQMFLACTYSEEDYKKETERIRNIQEEYRKEVKRVIYDEEHFSFPAYVTAYASNHCYEYVLFPGNQRIIYVFIQFASKDELLFDQRFLPLDYHGYGENDQENGDSIYVFVQEDGTGIGLY